MRSFGIFKLDLNNAGRISIIRVDKIENPKDTEAALTTKVAEYVGDRNCNVFTCRNNPFVRIVLEDINELPFMEL